MSLQGYPERGGRPGAVHCGRALKAFAAQLRDTVMLPECGHWTQQERATEVNAAMIGFLKILA